MHRDTCKTHVYYYPYINSRRFCRNLLMCAIFWMQYSAKRHMLYSVNSSNATVKCTFKITGYPLFTHGIIPFCLRSALHNHIKNNYPKCELFCRMNRGFPEKVFKRDKTNSSLETIPLKLHFRGIFQHIIPSGSSSCFICYIFIYLPV